MADNRPTTDTIAEGGGEQSRPNLQEINEQPGQTDALEARRRAANQSERYSPDDLTVEDGEVRVRDDSLRQQAAERTPFAADDFRVEDDGEVRLRDEITAPAVEETGDTNIAIEPRGTATFPETGPNAGDDVLVRTLLDRDTITIRNSEGDVVASGRNAEDATDSTASARFQPAEGGEFSVFSGEQRVGSIRVDERGGETTVVGMDRAKEDRTAASADPDIVAGAGADEALQAGVKPEVLSQVNPISESEGQRIADAVEQAEAQQQQQQQKPDRIGEGMSDTALAQRGSEANRRLRERIASDRGGLDASQVDVVATDDGLAYRTDGDTIGEADLDFGTTEAQDAPATAPSAREVFDGDVEGRIVDGPQPQPSDTTRITDPSEVEGQSERVLENPGEARAAVNRFGQRQLEQTDPSEQFGDVPIFNPFTTGGTADGQPSTLAPGAALATDPLVGDPGDDPRTEEQLNAAGDDVRGFLAGAAEASSEGVPAGGGPLGTLSGIARVEQTSRVLASELGYDVEQTDEGRFEEAAERGVVNAADVFNPPAAAAEGKEIAEFAATQPPRVLDSLAAAGEGAQEASTGRPLSVSPSAALATDPPVDEAEGAVDAAAATPFVQDVEQRGERVAATAAEEFSSNPLGATAAAAGGLAGSAAFGAGAGRLATNLPGVSGSDLSGRALKGAGRVAADAELPDVRGPLARFASDERGQGDLTLGGESGQETISSDDLITERALAEPEGEGRLASPPDDVSGGARDRQAAGLNEQGAFVGSNTNQQDAAFGGTGKPDTSGMDFSNVEFEELPRLQDRGETAPDAGDVTGRSVDEDTIAPGIDATTAAAGAGVTVPGLLGTPTEAARATQSGGFLGADDLVDSTAAVGPDVGVGADVDAGQFTSARAGSLSDGRQDSGLDVRQDNRFDQFQQPDTRVDVGGRFDTRVDTRVGSRVDTRQDTRYDLQQDSRFDTRFDTSTDTRTDTRFDTRFDTRIDVPTDRPEPERDQFDPVGAAGTAPQRFENPVETPGDFLGLGEFRGRGRDEEELEEIDASGGGFGGFGGGFQGFDGADQGDDGADQGDDGEIDPTGGLF